MKSIRGLSVLFILFLTQCKTASIQQVSKIIDTNSPPPSDASLYNAASERLTCSGDNLLPSDIFNRFVQHEGLSDADWQIQKLALQSSLSAVPVKIILQLIAHGGELRVVKNPKEHCQISESNIPKDKPISYCINETETKFTIYLAAYEGEKASIKPANTDAVYSLVEIYMKRVFSRQLTNKEPIPRSDAFITAYTKIMNQFYKDLMALGLTLPSEAQEDLFISISNMSLCSDLTRSDLRSLIARAQEEIETLIERAFQEDRNSEVLQKLLSETKGLPKNFYDDSKAKYRSLTDDQEVFKSSQERYKNEILSSKQLTEEEKKQALKDLEKASKSDPTAPFLYKSALNIIRNKPAFKAIYLAKYWDKTTGCFFQVPKETSLLTFKNAISGSTQRITITVHGTFDSSEVKVGGTWADPLGETAQRYVLVSHGRYDMKLNESDLLGAFRWKGENNSQNRIDAANALARTLIQMTSERNSLHPISKKAPLEITLIGHSHGGNVSYLTLNAIQYRAEKGDVEAKMFLHLISEASLKVRVIGIATPQRADYIPPSWAGIIQVFTKDDGVAFIGQADQINQIYRYFGKDGAKAWENNSHENINFINMNTYGLGEVFGANHILAPEALLGHLQQYPLPATYLNPN